MFAGIKSLEPVDMTSIHPLIDDVPIISCTLPPFIVYRGQESMRQDTLGSCLIEEREVFLSREDRMRVCTGGM